MTGQQMAMRVVGIVCLIAAALLALGFWYTMVVAILFGG